MHSYLPIEGYGPYCRLLEELAFGSESEVLTTNRVSTIQALGGTGALYVGGLFAKTALGIRHASVPNLTWGNHRALFRLGGLTVSDYGYYDKAKGCLSFERMLEDIHALSEPSLVLLQVCCHNPTGLDLSPEEWKLVLETVAACGHLAFLDMATKVSPKDFGRMQRLYASLRRAGCPSFSPCRSPRASAFMENA